MSKYSNEFKLEVVKYCIEGHHQKIGHFLGSVHNSSFSF